jgi:tetratricopeptide (TPR) repeat protein
MSKKKKQTTGTPKPMGPLGTEQAMNNLTKIMQEQEFETIEEANAFIQKLMEETGGFIPDAEPETPLEEAQQLVYEAYDARTKKKRIQLAKKALDISPDCADAYILLADEDANTPREARVYYQQALEAGERAIGPEVFEEDAGHFWGITETRPYMRARAALAQLEWMLGNRRKAIDHLKDMLRLNPNDNQGVRYVLINWLLETGEPDEIQAVLDQFADDIMAGMLYSRALWAFKRFGDIEEARDALANAIKQNPHVPPFLLFEKIPSQKIPEFMGVGDESEAVVYTADARTSWQRVDGALDWLDQVSKS